MSIYTTKQLKKEDTNYITYAFLGEADSDLLLISQIEIDTFLLESSYVNYPENSYIQSYPIKNKEVIIAHNNAIADKFNYYNLEFTLEQSTIYFKVYDLLKKFKLTINLKDISLNEELNNADETVIINKEKIIEITQENNSENFLLYPASVNFFENDEIVYDVTDENCEYVFKILGNNLILMTTNLDIIYTFELGTNTMIEFVATNENDNTLVPLAFKVLS
jgi:hypothetical protein